MFNFDAVLEEGRICRALEMGQRKESSHFMKQYIREREWEDLEDHFEKYEIKELPTNFNTRGPRSVRLHKGKEFKNGYGKETLFWNIGVDTGGDSKKLVSIIEILGKARQGKVAEVMAAVLIGLCWGLRG